MFQHGRVFGNLSVLANVLMGAHARRQMLAPVAWGLRTNFSTRCFNRPRPEVKKSGCVRRRKRSLDYKERINQLGGVLSGGEQPMLAIGRALIGRPRLICMDEPTMGLSPLFVDRVLELIQVINAQGITIFMVEQNANLAL
jgi:ABC-type branched-subunit amino acid transport system ATPase component